MNQSTASLAAYFPRYAPIPRAIEITGLARSTIYKLAGQGKLRLVKAGGRTLVDMDHAMQWMGTLPLASIAPGTTHTTP